MESSTEVVVQDGAIRSPHFVFGGVGIVHVVGWIGEHHVRDLAGHQRIVGAGVRRVTADDAMITADPDIPRARYRCAGVGNRILIGLTIRRRLLSGEKIRECIGIEARQR